MDKLVIKNDLQHVNKPLSITNVLVSFKNQ